MPSYSYVKKDGKEINLAHQACLSFMRTSREKWKNVDYVNCKLTSQPRLSVDKWMSFLKSLSFFKDNLIFYNGNCILPSHMTYQECVFVYSAARYILEFPDRAVRIIHFHEDLHVPKEMAFIMGHYYEYDKFKRVFNKIYYSSGHAALPPHPTPISYSSVLNQIADRIRSEFQPWTKEIKWIMVYKLISDQSKTESLPPTIPFTGKVTTTMEKFFG